MILDIIFCIFISILMIISLHSFYYYLKDNYTIKKIKYLGQFQNEKYQEIINELKNQSPKLLSSYISMDEKETLKEYLFDYMKTI